LSAPTKRQARQTRGRDARTEPAVREAAAGPETAMRRRLRAERERRGLSVRGLAAEIGISPSALSQIETGRSRPSVSTLYAIVSALGLSFDGLFAAAPQEGAGGRAAHGQGADGRGAGGRGAAAGSPAGDDAPAPPPGDGAAANAGSRRVFVHRGGEGESIEFTSGVRWDRLNPPGDVVEALWLTYPPGAASGAADQFMRHAGHEYGVVVSGRLGVSVGFESYELAPGDAIAFPSTAPHRLTAAGDDAVLAVWFVLSGDLTTSNRGDFITSSMSSRTSRDT
jgi:DNA-binding XRE family transcriptional regulator/quercetin dioxygenase-like cupin family protein